MRIERTAPRALFGELVAGALGEVPVSPSPLATTYLVELLTERVRARGPRDEPTLAEDLLRARGAEGPERIRGLRGVGDRALFVSGFFGDSLARSLVDLDYYRAVGREAYGSLAGALSGAREPSWSRLFGELAGRFGDFVDVLAEVGERARGRTSRDLLRLYERYVLTGSERDRQRLLRRGCTPPRPGRRSWQ